MIVSPYYCILDRRNATLLGGVGYSIVKSTMLSPSLVHIDHACLTVSKLYGRERKREKERERLSARICTNLAYKHTDIIIARLDQVLGKFVALREMFQWLIIYTHS